MDTLWFVLEASRSLLRDFSVKINSGSISRFVIAHPKGTRYIPNRMLDGNFGRASKAMMFNTGLGLTSMAAMLHRTCTQFSLYIQSTNRMVCLSILPFQVSRMRTSLRRKFRDRVVRRASICASNTAHLQ